MSSSEVARQLSRELSLVANRDAVREPRTAPNSALFGTLDFGYAPADEPWTALPSPLVPSTPSLTDPLRMEAVLIERERHWRNELSTCESRHEKQTEMLISQVEELQGLLGGQLRALNAERVPDPGHTRSNRVEAVEEALLEARGRLSNAETENLKLRLEYIEQNSALAELRQDVGDERRALAWQREEALVDATELQQQLATRNKLQTELSELQACFDDRALLVQELEGIDLSSKIGSLEEHSDRRALLGTELEEASRKAEEHQSEVQELRRQADEREVVLRSAAASLIEAEQRHSREVDDGYAAAHRHAAQEVLDVLICRLGKLRASVPRREGRTGHIEDLADNLLKLMDVSQPTVVGLATAVANLAAALWEKHVDQKERQEHKGLDGKQAAALLDSLRRVTNECRRLTEASQSQANDGPAASNRTQQVVTETAIQRRPQVGGHLEKKTSAQCRMQKHAAASASVPSSTGPIRSLRSRAGTAPHDSRPSLAGSGQNPPMVVHQPVPATKIRTDVDSVQAALLEAQRVADDVEALLSPDSPGFRSLPRAPSSPGVAFIAR